MAFFVMKIVSMRLHGLEIKNNTVFFSIEHQKSEAYSIDKSQKITIGSPETYLDTFS